MTIILLLIFLVGIGSATFIEDKYDTTTARLLVYNAWWFDIVLVLLALNFIGNIKRYNLFSWKKAPNLTFHVAFIILILGAGVTRFTGFEATMHIRKGEASNIIYSSVPYFSCSLIVDSCSNNDKRTTINYEKPLLLSEAVNNGFHISMNVQNSPLSIKYKSFMKNAVEKAEENVAGGTDIIGLTIAGENGNQTVYIKDGEIKDLGKISVAFNENRNLKFEIGKSTLLISEKEGKLYIISPYNIRRSQMMLAVSDTIFKNNAAELLPNYIYNTNGVMFAFSKLYINAKMVIAHGSEEENGSRCIDSRSKI